MASGSTTRDGSGAPIQNIKDYGFEVGGPIRTGRAWYWGSFGKQDVKAGIVTEREYLNLRLDYEDVAEFEYRPGKCSRSYRVVARPGTRERDSLISGLDETQGSRPSGACSLTRAGWHSVQRILRTAPATS